MRETCVLHIGMHKTGTSSIQNVLYNFNKNDRFHYGNLQSPNHSGEIYSIFSENPDAYHGNAAIGVGGELLQSRINKSKEMLIKGFLSAPEGSIEILSGEDIGILNRREIERLELFLRKYFKKIVVVAYVRSLHSYVQSSFQELVKHGLNCFDLPACDPNYIRFKDFESVFGTENVIIRMFEKKNLVSGSVVPDFFRTIGIDLPSDFIDARDNESLSFEAIKLLYTYHKFVPGSQGLKYTLEGVKTLGALQEIGDKKLVFSDELISPLVEKNKIGMNYLMERFGLDVYSPVNAPVTVFSESDLFQHDVEAVKALQSLIGVSPFASGYIKTNPESVAAAMKALVSGGYKKIEPQVGLGGFSARPKIKFS